MKLFTPPTIFLTNPNIIPIVTNDFVRFLNTSTKISLSSFECVAVIGKIKVPNKTILQLFAKGKSVFIIPYFPENNYKIIVPSSKDKFLKKVKFSQLSEWQRFYLFAELAKIKNEIFYSLKAKKEPFLKKVYHQMKKNFNEILRKRASSNPEFIENFLKGLDTLMEKWIIEYLPARWKDIPYKDLAVSQVLNLVWKLTLSFLILSLIQNGWHPYKGVYKEIAVELLEIVKPFLAFFVFTLFNSEYLNPSDFTFSYIKPKAAKVICKLYTESVFGGKILNNILPWFEEVKKAIKE